MSPHPWPPTNHTPPHFPALYWPFGTDDPPRYLYTLHEIWRFTLLWTLLIYALFHLAVVWFAVTIQLGKGISAWKYIWIIPLVYFAVAGLEAVLAGSLVGLMLGAVYNSGYFKMSTWVPLIWSLINVLILIISSFSIQGGL